MQDINTSVAEPVGIVISRGREIPKAPVFRAYVYSAAPEAETDTTVRAA